jgi:hypothetical protein
MKLIDHWTSSGQAAETSGQMEAGTKASRYSEGSERKSTSSGRYGTSSRRLELWTNERPDGMTRRPDG